MISTTTTTKEHVLKDSAVDNTRSNTKKKKRTFADVATCTTTSRQKHVFPSAALGSDWLPQFAKARGSEKEKACSSRLPPPSNEPFEDWTPCTTVRISCETLSEKKKKEKKKKNNIRDVVEADLRHVSSGIYDRVSNRDDENLRLAMTAATSTWTFPQRCMSPGVFRSLPDDVKKERRHDWKEALCSVYDMYKSATEPFVFYVSSPEYQSSRSSHPKYTVMFATSKTSKSQKQRMHAVLSQSTKGLRSLLHSCGIGFEAPLLKDPLKSKDQGARSILVFEGALRVHGMFDILLNKAIGGMSHDDCDVPCVHAPGPFRNATMVKIPCQIQSSTVTIGGSHSSWIPPWTIRRILQCLVSTEDYTIWLTPVPDVSRGCMNSYGECLLSIEYNNGMFTAVKASAPLAPV